MTFDFLNVFKVTPLLMKYVSIGMTFLFYCVNILQLIICVLVLEQEKNELVELSVGQKI